jgi:hypothetical protein
MPARSLAALPPLLATGSVPADALAAVASADDQPLAVAVGRAGSCLLHGEAWADLSLCHVGLSPDADSGLASETVRHLVAETRPALLWAPAEVERLNFGFWRFINGCRLAFPPGKPSPGVMARLRVLSAADQDAVYDLAQRRAAEFAGPGIWPKAAWLRWSAFDDGGWLGCEMDGELHGAIGVRYVRRGDAVRARIECLLDDQPAAFASLMGYVAHLTESGIEVLVDTLPPDRPAVEVGDVVSKQRAEPDRRWAVRAGLPEVWLSAMRYAADGECRLGIRDPLGIWPSAIHLRWGGGRLRDWAPVAEADLQLGIEALMGLASGQLTVAHLVYRGWLGGPAEALASVQHIWAVQPLHRFGWDSPYDG